MTQVLIVDDKPENVYYMEALLRAQGYETETARHGAEALVKARQSPPDVVIADLLMPVMDGYMLLRHWKADARLKQVPFIVYTATYTDAEDEQLATNLGADAFILKPAEPEDFLARLRQVQASVAPAVAPVTQQPPADEQKLLRHYSETLIRKLEEKTLQLQETNRSLAEDIAARRRAEEALRESETSFRVLTEVMPQLVWITRADGWNIFANQRWLDYTGLSASESEGDGWLRAFHPDDQERAKVIWRATLEQGGTFELEAQLRKVDGSYCWWLIRGLPLRSSTGAITKWFGTCTDIDGLKDAFSARDKAERDASERAAVMDALFESVPDVVTQLDTAGRIRLENHTSSQCERQARLGSSWLSAGSSEECEVRKRAFESVIASGKPTSFESTQPGEHGATTSWNTIAPVVRDGKSTGAVVVARDITERKQTEAQLIVSDRMASVGILAAGVAHEINNPLATVIANLGLVSQDLEALSKSRPVPRDLLDEIHDAREGAERVRLIVRDLKIFSRAEEDERGPVDVEQVLDSTLRMAWNELRHRARLVKLYGRVASVMANEPRLGQVFLNLIVNAAQAIPEGDYKRNEIRIETYEEGGRVVISIRDTGLGIPPEIQRRLFTPFVTTKPRGEGTGLGLSICHRIITALDGTIDFTSELGKGTTFRVSLPIARLEPRVEAPTHSAPVVRCQRRRVLVIDDEITMADAVRRMLFSECEVQVVHSAEAAMELFKAGARFDVVLCDLMMPQVTGMELYGRLLGLDPRQAAQVVFMTGGAFTPAARRFLDSVPNRRIEKPFELQALRALVNGPAD